MSMFKSVPTVVAYFAKLVKILPHIGWKLLGILEFLGVKRKLVYKNLYTEKTWDGHCPYSCAPDYMSVLPYRVVWFENEDVVKYMHMKDFSCIFKTLREYFWPKNNAYFTQELNTCHLASNENVHLLWKSERLIYL